MKETWFFIDTDIQTPAFNMALDEALLNWHSQGLIPPVLRFYQWKPAGLSLGYFQKIQGKIRVEAVEKHGFDMVRRLTGGRAVLHDHELTYSVVVSEEHEKMPKTVTEAYRVISQGILEGYRNLGIQAEFSIPERKLGKNSSAVCFEEPSWYELVIDGKKAAGSAQTRQKGVILQHGSVPISMDTEVLFDLFEYSSDKIRQRAKEKFAERAITIEEVLKREVPVEEVKDAFYEGFRSGLGIELQPFELTSEQLEEVQNLADTRYSTDAWTYKREKAEGVV
ncbi:lipoate-protein ligase A [Melghiribacillus thermohalophilus]|uniref:Lipoate-protein ligase A n=1 Tax=Melghiribacillus thermohalophilus TaxID=1324956 RepID=A0A4R3N1F0_9BACI|nr:biotin/lipoate A/B protein ligase family protein [Melghiribacillus thermohalophilus]TCT20893.1 lipoate-protein ligase A [Melghiribacillus thermohalophilus]